jgi:hypothetical protein
MFPIMTVLLIFMVLTFVVVLVVLVFVVLVVVIDDSEKNPLIMRSAVS